MMMYKQTKESKKNLVELVNLFSVAILAGGILITIGSLIGENSNKPITGFIMLSLGLIGYVITIIVKGWFV